MWLFGVVPDVIFHQFPVEDKWFIDFIYMPGNELLLNGPVEALQMAVGLRMLGVVKDMYQVIFLTGQGKMLLEFMAVIRLNPSYLKGDYNLKLVKEVT